MKYIFFMLAFFLAGCSGPFHIYPAVNEAAKKVCEGNDGVKYVIVDRYGVDAHCNNGAYFYSIIKVKNLKAGV